MLNSHNSLFHHIHNSGCHIRLLLQLGFLINKQTNKLICIKRKFLSHDYLATLSFLNRHVVLLLHMNMYLAFIIHDIGGRRQQAACGSNVHHGHGQARRRYPKSLMTRFFASEFFISHFPSTGPHHALSTNLLYCSTASSMSNSNSL